MSRFLLALVCLSTLAMAQNRVVATPDLESAHEATLSAASIVGENVPRPAATILLIVGLSGLAAAGNRPARRRDRAQT
jgi:hypothetical protein